MKRLTQLIATVSLISVTFLIANQRVIAQSANSDIRINSIKLEETLVAEVMNGYLEVPNKNTTVSAYGGSMRLYDVHIARMIALSHHFYCKQPYIDNMEKLFAWQYRADNGKIDMGTFNLRCNQVEQAVKTYGLGKSVPMVVQMTNGTKKTVNVPLLDIQGDAETQSFLAFVQTIKPQG